jgi:chromosome segregation ATPase
MQPNPAEIEAIRAQIAALQQECASLSVESPESNSSQMQLTNDDLAQIVESLAALAAQLRQKRAEFNALQVRSQYHSIEQHVEEGRTQAKVHAERINELAAELAEEIRSLKAIADRISPSYWQVYYKPFITGFQTISVPYVRSDGDVWTIVNRVV